MFLSDVRTEKKTLLQLAIDLISNWERLKLRWKHLNEKKQVKQTEQVWFFFFFWDFSNDTWKNLLPNKQTK